MNCSPSGSSVHGIFWARIIEWVAISFFRASFLARDWICVSACPSLQVDSLPLSHPHEGWGDVDKLLHIHFFAIILISEITGCLLLLCCSLEFPWVTFISFKLFIFYCFCGRCKLWDLLLFHFMLGAGMRTSTRGKGHEEGGSTYAKAGSSFRSPPGNAQASTPKTRVCLLDYFVLSPTPLTLRGAVPHHLFRRRC